jgi:hypothetical protein
VNNTNNSDSSAYADPISGTISSTVDKKKGTSTAAIDLINALANPTSNSATGTSTPVGKTVALNDSLSNKATLSGTLASSTSLSGTPTYTLNPVVSQTFVSQDLSKTPSQQFGVNNSSTFAILENLRQVLVSILQMLRPFGGVVPGGTNITPRTME